MARLIVKSPYLKCGGSRGAGGYLRYIGTRERVELLPDDRPPTRKQEQLVHDLMRDYPDMKSFGEYADYTAQPTKARASALISAALETHWEDAQRSDVYMKYIATRPRAERLGSHGLFGDEDYVDLNAAMDELDHYTGNVWTHIISLKREDATRLGYDNAKAWRDLLRAHRNDVAAAMHVAPQASSAYHRLREAITDTETPLDVRDDCVEELTQLAEGGEQYAQYFLGKLYRDGGLLIPDDEQAEKWFRRAAENGLGCAAYALGKLLQSQGSMKEAAGWYEHAVTQGNEYAEYQLAKLYLTGRGVPKDADRAVELLEASAEQGNQYAEYALGKLYLDGTLVQKDAALGMAYMERAAQQGNAYAQLFADRQDSLKPSSVMLSVTRLFRSMGEVFRDNSLPQSGAMQTGLDRKRMQELIEQKGYEAAASYAREYQAEQQYGGMSMATPW